MLEALDRKTPLLVVMAVLIVMNLVSFALMGIDKRRAQRGAWRISEKALFLTTACFGGLGGVMGICINLGKQVKPFDSNVWNAVKYGVVKTANRAKYDQNPDLKDKLLDTGDAILAEASPKDTIWGIGLDAVTAAEINPSEWPGQNLLGIILMELRSEFAGKKAEALK